MALKPVYVLLNNLFFAEKIVKTAKAVGLEARAFDTADRLVERAKQKEPALVMMDCEGLEKESFRLLEALQADEALSRAVRIGYLSHKAQDLKRLMREAGCTQVYTKSDFTKELENLLTRHAHGFPSRV